MEAFFRLIFILTLSRKCHLHSIPTGATIWSAAGTTVPLPVELGESSDATNGAKNMWWLILLAVVLCIIVVVVSVQLLTNCYKQRLNTRHSQVFIRETEMQILLNGQEPVIETVARTQQPTISSDGTSEQRTSINMVNVKQQLPVLESSSNNSENVDESTTKLIEKPQDFNTRAQPYKELQKSSAQNGPRGLRNIGNTCYFNSVMQCLTYALPFTEQVSSPALNGELFLSLREFLRNMKSDRITMPTCDGKDVLSKVLGKTEKFRRGQQHDSHEFLRHFLDELRKEERDGWADLGQEEKKKRLTVVDQVFGGHLVTVYTCKKCHVPYHLFERLLDISVPVCFNSLTSFKEDSELSNGNEADATDSFNCDDSSNRDAFFNRDALLYRDACSSIMIPLVPRSVQQREILKYPQENPSVEDCLGYFTRLELMENAYFCNNCFGMTGDMELTTASRRTLLFNPPALLVLHLKRFQLVENGFVKLENLVTYKKLLDVGPFCSSWCRRNEEKDLNLSYSLFGVVVHSGSLTSGHYVAYVKLRDSDKNFEKFLQKKFFDCDLNPQRLVKMMEEVKSRKPRMTPQRIETGSDGVWFLMNDSSVHRVNQNEVLNQEAYLLFYERLNSSR